MTCSSCLSYALGICLLTRQDRSPDRETCDEFKAAGDMRSFESVARALGYKVVEVEVRHDA